MEARYWVVEKAFGHVSESGSYWRVSFEHWCHLGGSGGLLFYFRSNFPISPKSRTRKNFHHKETQQSRYLRPQAACKWWIQNNPLRWLRSCLQIRTSYPLFHSLRFFQHLGHPSWKGLGQNQWLLWGHHGGASGRGVFIPDPVSCCLVLVRGAAARRRLRLEFVGRFVGRPDLELVR